MKAEGIQDLADKVTGGNVQALGRLLGLTPRGIQSWASGERKVSPMVDLIAELFEVLAGDLGDSYAQDAFVRSAKALGRTVFTPSRPLRG